MDKNIGDNKILEEGEVSQYWPFYYEKDNMVSLYSVSDMVFKGHHVYINACVESSFIVTDKDRKTKIPCNKQGFYVKEPTRTIVFLCAYLLNE